MTPQYTRQHSSGACAKCFARRMVNGKYTCFLGCETVSRQDSLEPAGRCPHPTSYSQMSYEVEKRGLSYPEAEPLSIAALGINRNIRRHLRESEIFNISELLALGSLKELLSVPGIGPKAVDEIISKLTECGYDAAVFVT